MQKLMLKIVVVLSIVAGSPAVWAGKQLQFEQLPAAVKATALREIKAGRVLEVEEDSEQGQLVYEIDFVDAGVSWEIDIAPDGTLLRRVED